MALCTASGPIKRSQLPEELLEGDASYEQRQRSRELYRYFEALSIAPGLDRSKKDGDVKLNTGAWMPADANLLALTQLGAYKLNANRSFISLLDRHVQYIISEATQSVSLQDGNNHSENDGLYLGDCMVELAFGVCPQAIEIFTGDNLTIDTPNITADASAFIIRDFCADPVYSEKPYVLEWPHIRSFLEVPITSPTGYVIGSYCVVDNKARAWEDRDIVALTEISSAIMAHLDLLRLKVDHGRAERLIQGLGSFVTGSSSLAEHHSTPYYLSKASSNTEQDHERSMSQDLHSDISHTLYSSHSTSRSTITSPSITSTPPTRLTESNPLGDYVGHHKTAVVAEAEACEETLSSATSASLTVAQPIGTAILSRSVSSSLARASNLVRQAMELTGVVFLDAYTDQSYDHRYETSTSASSNVRQCTTLGYSTLQESSFDYDNTSQSIIALDANMMDRLLESFPAGHVFTADEAGIIASKISQTPLAEPKRPVGGQDIDFAELFDHLPMARSIIFLPIRDHEKDRWFTAIIAWTTDNARVFAINDLNYLSAFGNSIVADISSLETATSSDAKSDLISSISHELRSPLHGILAGSEILREAKISSSDVAVLDNIDICGNILLDTLNHLMDYAKINAYKPGRLNIAEGSSTILDKDQARSSIINVAHLVQDVVEGIYFGTLAKNYQMHPSMDADGMAARSHKHPQDLRQDTVVLVDIDPSADMNVYVETGAWKRIIMNLFGNALKYTSHGVIQLKVNIEAPPETEHDMGSIAKVLRLEIDDTGRGMSSDFLRHRLFQPFVQENNLSQGAGLGMSIVKRLVEDLAGTIKVKSKLGLGTQIVVDLPLSPNMIPALSMSSTQRRNVTSSKELRGLTVTLPRLESVTGSNTQKYPKSPATHNVTTRTHLAQAAQQWFGITIREDENDDALKDSLQISLTPASDPRRTVVREWLLQSRTTNVEDAVRVVKLQSPLGPRKLATALLEVISDAKHSIQAASSPLASPLSEAEESLTMSMAAMNGVSPASASKRRILVVDDNPINVKVMQSTVEKAGCDVTTASNGMAAVEAFAANPSGFHTIFMDLSMPVMDGYAATRRIRELEQEQQLSEARTTIVALTALGSGVARQNAFDAGVDSFLCKPVKMKEIREQLKLNPSMNSGDPD